MLAPEQALPLVTCENGKMILHEEVAEKIFESEEARIRPVAVISIAGEFRKGKSFFLNFVLRYLKAKCDPNWIRCESGPLEGFEWKSNIEGVTSGITIWPEVFVVKEVAIVLIDTQGLFDISKSTAEDTYIMVLSFLFSSFQILNHHVNLNSADLKDFELFATYGMALEGKTKNFKGFQNLLFLIRDWIHESQFSFGLEGGKQYLDDFLKTKLNEELRSAEETFNHCEKVECFLMPYPGKNVARNEKFKGDFNQMEDLFLENTKTLVEHLIENVKPKKVLSLKSNGENLLHVMKNYVEYINARQLPEPKSLLQLQIDLLHKRVESNGMSIYNDRMRDETNDNLLNKTKMDELHKQCADAAIGEFNSLEDLVNEEQFETSKSKFLQMIIANEYTHYKKAMEEKVESKLESIFKKSKKSYNTVLCDISGQSKNVENLKTEMLKCREAAITDFQEKTNFGDSERVKDLLESLIQYMDEKQKKSEADYLAKHRFQQMSLSFVRAVARTSDKQVVTAATGAGAASGIAVGFALKSMVGTGTIFAGTIGLLAATGGPIPIAAAAAIVVGLSVYGSFELVKRFARQRITEKEK